MVSGATGHSRSLDAWKVIPMTTVKQILRETDNEFKLRYQQTFSDLTSQLHITPGTAYQSFEQEMYELFRDGVNWDSWPFFLLVGHCVESIDKEMQVLVSQITTWMATYLNDHLEPWIQENGGWVRTTLLMYSFSLASGQIPNNLSPVSVVLGDYYCLLRRHNWPLCITEVNF